MNSLIKNITIGLKGFGMGAANVIPGVSGGTIALLTGIYEELIGSISALSDLSAWKELFKGNFKAFWKHIHGSFLTALLVGVLLSIFSLAKLMQYTIVYHPVQTWAFFFGLIVASSYYMLRDVREWKIADAGWLIGGIVLGLVICTLSPASTPDDLWFIFICGAVAVCTMILPGISGSFILVIFSKYEYIMGALSDFNVPVLLVFGLGCVVGIAAFSRFLHWLLARAERPTMLVLVGFVIGSLIKVWPWSDKMAAATAECLGRGADLENSRIMAKTLIETCETAGASLWDSVNLHVGGAVLWAVLGALLVIGLEMLGSRQKETEAGA